MPPRRDLLGVIERVGTHRDPWYWWRVAVAHRADEWQVGSLASAKELAEAWTGEALWWEQVSETRWEAWSHRV